MEIILIQYALFHEKLFDSKPKLYPWVAMHVLSVTNCSFDVLFVVLTEAGRGVNLPSLGPQRLVKSHVLNHCLRLD